MHNMDLVELRKSIAERASPSDRALLSQLDIRPGDGEVIIFCPSSFVCQVIKKQHHEMISRAIENFSGKKVGIGYEVSSIAREVPLQKARPMQMMLPSRDMLVSSFGVNPRFTFESFVVGKCNSLAYEVAKAVSQDNSCRYNPVYFNSDIGLGKSHIAHSIGNMVLSSKTKARVKFTSAREFSQEYVYASRNGCMDRFRHAYKPGTADIFFLDDVHMLSSKEKTQMELSSIIDEMMCSGVQVIFSGYRPPASIPDIDKSLKSRFEAGLVLDIKKPDRQTRAAIVRSKGIREGEDLDEEVIDFISRNIDTNIRELESAVMTVCAMGTFMKRPVKLDLAMEVLEGTLERKSRINIPMLIAFVAKHFGVSVEALTSPSRKRELAYPRHITIFLCRRYTKETLQSIGHAFKRKHTSIIHSLELMEHASNNNLKTRKELDWLIEMLERS